MRKFILLIAIPFLFSCELIGVPCNNKEEDIIQKYENLILEGVKRDGNDYYNSQQYHYLKQEYDRNLKDAC